MRKFILAALAAAATLGAAAIAPATAEARPLTPVANEVSAPVEMQYYYGGGYRHGYGGYRPYRPHYGYRRYGPPAYIAPPYYGPRCFIRQRWIDTPYGPRLRNVRICR